MKNDIKVEVYCGDTDCQLYKTEITKYTTMSKKTYKLVVGCIGAAATLANVLVAYFEPAGQGAIIAAIGIAATAAIEICDLFVKEE